MNCVLRDSWNCALAFSIDVASSFDLADDDVDRPIRPHSRKGAAGHGRNRRSSRTRLTDMNSGMRSVLSSGRCIPSRLRDSTEGRPPLRGRTTRELGLRSHREWLSAAGCLSRMRRDCRSRPCAEITIVGVPPSRRRNLEVESVKHSWWLDSGPHSTPIASGGGPVTPHSIAPQARCRRRLSGASNFVVFTGIHILDRRIKDPDNSRHLLNGA